MRCLSCDKRLSDYESSLKDEQGQFLDFCLRCYAYIRDDVVVTGNPRLAHSGDDEDLDSNEEECYNSPDTGTEEER